MQTESRLLIMPPVNCKHESRSNMLTRSSKVPAHVWEKYRPVITKMYIEEELELEDLRATMLQEYNFDAGYVQGLGAFG
jgi:hypothetical protein